jgi:hypothetical protein
METAKPLSAVTRTEFTVAELRRRARLSDDADQARRTLAIALVLEGPSRAEAARHAPELNLVENIWEYLRQS